MVSALSNNSDHGGRTGLAEYNNAGEFVASHWLPTDGDLRGAKKTGKWLMDMAMILEFSLEETLCLHLLLQDGQTI
ncbi:MAG: hypothetical protein CM15mP93_10760 [Thiotrichaceae bacterium]|nr:MAG: hypothetical protein CM15mP93_10760 [Thiotrichaceae bacterium]